MKKNSSSIILTAPKGLIPLLRKEVASLQYPIRWASESAIRTEGTYDDCMYLNLWLRTAHHILFEIMSFQCDSLSTLYKSVVSFPWETVVDEHGYISVTVSVNHQSIRDYRIVSMKCKDAIVDRITSKKGTRPNSGTEKNKTVISVFWQQGQCTVSIDTSGEPLTKRGYRRIPLAAPMQETLAAALVYSTGFDGTQCFVNPMCGSGTIAIEAALIGINKAPGLTRNNFGFIHTHYFEPEKWKRMRKQALENCSKWDDNRIKIIAGDSNMDAINAARKNAVNAGVENYIQFTCNDFRNTKIPSGNGIIFFNPQYGFRMGHEIELIEIYRDIGRFMKHACAGYTGYIFTGNTKLSGQIGLKSRQRIKFQSGTIDCRLYVYDLFQGKRT